MIVAAVEIHPGDRVAAHDDHPAYEVSSVDVQQGRVQVADTVGEVHTYHRDDTVDVARVG